MKAARGIPWFPRVKFVLLIICSSIVLTGPHPADAIRPAKIEMPVEKETLGKYVPNARLYNTEGKEFSLRDIMDDKPLVLSFIYTRCTTACLVITDSVKEVTEKVGGIGEDYKVLTISFDERDMVHDIEKFRRDWELDGKNWIVAGGAKEEVDKIINTVQFDYTNDKITGEFIHPNFVVVLTPQMRISRYIYGVFPEERDFEISILEAREGSSSFSPLTDGLILRCYRYDEVSGTYMLDYSFIIGLVMGAATILAIFLVTFGKGIFAFLFKRNKE